MNKEESLAKIKEYHDELKNHPFFKTFNRADIPSMRSLYYKMTSCYYGCKELCEGVRDKNLYDEYYYSTPQGALISAMNHDMNSCMGELNEENISRHIVAIQSYISLFHGLIEEKENATFVYLTKNLNTKKYVATKHPKGYRATAVRPLEKKEKLIENIKEKIKQYETSSRKGFYTYYCNCLDDIEKRNNVYHTFE